MSQVASPAEMWRRSDDNEAESQRIISRIGQRLNRTHGCNHSDIYWNAVIGLPIRTIISWATIRQPSIDERNAATSPAWEGLQGQRQNLPVVPSTNHALTLLRLRYPNYIHKLEIDSKIMSNDEAIVASQLFIRPAIKSRMNAPALHKFQGHRLGGRASIFRGQLPLVEWLSQPIRTRGKGIPTIGLGEGNDAFVPDWGLRESIFSSDTDDDAVLRSLLWALACTVPSMVVEGHSAVEKAVESYDRGEPRSALIAPGIGELDRHLVGLQAEKGARIHFVQHGGRYGESIPTPRETYERSVSDTFVSWGWEEEGVMGLPSPKLDRFRARYVRHRQRLGTDPSLVLWVTDEQSLVGNSPPFESQVQYERRQSALAQHMPSKVRSLVQVRLRPQKSGTDTLEGYSWVADSGLSFADSTLGFDSALAQAGLVLIDRPFSTSFLEAIAVDKPALVFAPCFESYIRDTVSVVYNSLREAGIICHNSDEVLKAVHQYHKGVWWDSEKRRRAYKIAKYSLARTTDAGPSNRFAALIG